MCFNKVKHSRREICGYIFFLSNNVRYCECKRTRKICNAYNRKKSFLFMKGDLEMFVIDVYFKNGTGLDIGGEKYEIKDGFLAIYDVDVIHYYNVNEIKSFDVNRVEM